MTNPVLINSCQDVYPACPRIPSLTVNTKTMGSCHSCLPFTRALQILIQSSPLYTNCYPWICLPVLCFVLCYGTRIHTSVYFVHNHLSPTALPPLLIPPFLNILYVALPSLFLFSEGLFILSQGLLPTSIIRVLDHTHTHTINSFCI